MKDNRTNKATSLLLMIGIAFILGTAGLNLLFPVNPEVLPLVKGGFYIGCFSIFIATLPRWFN